MRIKSILICLFLALAVMASAQTRNYHIHEVEAGETLYSIARKYDVKVKEIKKLNPDLDGDLPIGQRIVVPIRSKKEVDETRGYFEYEVKAQETLYSLSKRFKTTIPDLHVLNPELKKEGLRVGMMLKVPLVDSAPGHEEEDTLEETMKEDVLPLLEEAIDSAKLVSGFRDTLHVALMLPFMANKHDSLRRVYPQNPSINGESKIGLAYFRGVQLALDSLVKLGLNTRVYVYDTENSPKKIKSIMRRPEWSKINLVIGPLYGDNMHLIATEVRARRIPMISPFSRDHKLAKTYSNIWQCTPGYLQEAQYLGRYLGFKYKANRMVLVHQDTGKDVAYVQALKDNLRSIEGDTLEVKTWSYSKDVTGRLSWNGLPHDTGMVFILASTNPAFVTDFLTNLSVLDDHNPMVYTFSSIEKMRAIEPRIMNILNVHFTKAEFTNPKGRERLIQLALQAHKTVPDRFTALAFDQMLFFGGLLNEAGMMHSALVQEPKVFTQSGYYFLDKPGIGKVNHLLFLVRFEDFEIVRVK